MREKEKEEAFQVAVIRWYYVYDPWRNIKEVGERRRYKHRLVKVVPELRWYIKCLPSFQQSVQFLGFILYSLFNMKIAVSN